MPRPADMFPGQLRRMSGQQLIDEIAHYQRVRDSYSPNEDGYKWASKDIGVIQGEINRRERERQNEECERRWREEISRARQ